MIAARLFFLVAIVSLAVIALKALQAAYVSAGEFLSMPLDARSQLIFDFAFHGLIACFALNLVVSLASIFIFRKNGRTPTAPKNSE